MTLPSVVSDPVRCYKHPSRYEVFDDALPHDYEWIGLWWYERCRWCEGRKP